MRVVGRFGELLLRTFPEASEELNELMREEIEFWDDPSDNLEISPYYLSSEFRLRFLLPALRGLPQTAACLERCVRFMIDAATLDPDRTELYWEAIAIRVFDKVSDEDVSRLFTLSSELREIFEV